VRVRVRADVEVRVRVKVEVEVRMRVRVRLRVPARVGILYNFSFTKLGPTIVNIGCFHLSVISYNLMKMTDVF